MIFQRKNVLYKQFTIPNKKDQIKQSNTQIEQNNNQCAENYKQILLFWLFLLIIGVLIDKCNS